MDMARRGSSLFRCVGSERIMAEERGIAQGRPKLETSLADGASIDLLELLDAVGDGVARDVCGDGVAELC